MSPPDTPVKPAAEAKAAAWGRPFARLDSSWTRLESVLCAGVLLAEILALCLWIALKGLSTPTTSDNKAGLVFRAVLGAVALGLVAHRATKNKPLQTQRIATLGAVAVGLFASKAWASVGIDYFSNVLNWYQDASSLTLIGGLRGVGTRLTLWLALLGASLATASGKHINVDVVMRFLKPKARVPVAIVGWLAAAIVCLSAVWGFLDHIAIESFGAKAEASAGDKVAHIWRESSMHRFVFWKQVGLDVRTFPHVLKGERYDQWLHGAEWNAWVKDGGWDAHFDADEVKSILVPDSAANEIHSPLVVVPNGTNRGILGHDLFLVFPFGLLMIGLRFLLRCVLAASGHVKVDPDAAHDDPDAHRGEGPERLPEDEPAEQEVA